MFRNEYKTIKKSGLFDEKYYLEIYEDIRKADVNPIKHYIKYGWKEGRNPSKKFNTNFYIETYSDVKKSGLNPLVHYIRYGKKEGRKKHLEDSIQTENENINLKSVFKIFGYIKKNPHLIKRTLKEIKYNGLKKTLKKIRNKYNRVEESFILSKDITNLKELMNVFNEKILIPEIKTEIPIDIIIPVYNGFDFLNPLLSSIIKNTSVNFRIILCDDKSTDERVLPLLKEYKKNNINIILLENEQNLGFIKTVNKLVTYTNNHFVLLNTDTEVPPYWIERLMYPIFEMENVASTTPFTNAGTICSFPKYLEDNPIFENMTVVELDKYFQYIDFEKTFIEIPTGVGFCMGVNKNLVNKIGMFDEIFGKGYSEENDWCQRAIKAGYKNLHVTNLFVYHKHGGSFSSQEKKALQEKNFEILLSRYNNYSDDVNKVVEENKLDFLRLALKTLIKLDLNKEKFYKGDFSDLNIYYIGYLKSSIGVGRASLGYIKLLEKIGFNVIKFDLEDIKWQSKIRNSLFIDQPLFVINHYNATEMILVDNVLLNFCKKFSNTIGIWAWESNNEIEEFKLASIYLNSVWAISNYMSEALLNISCNKDVLLHIIDEEDEQEIKINQRLKAIREEYNFVIGYMFDLNSYYFRKNPEGVINCFKSTFKDNIDTCLILKISGIKGNEEAYNNLLKIINNDSRIKIFDTFWENGEINYFYKIIDVYLALFRSEGFGLTIAEAMLNKKTVICTNYSGVVDYIDDSVIKIDFEMIKIPENWGPYKKNWLWAEPNLEMASTYLKNLYKNRHLLDIYGTKSNQRIKEILSYESMKKPILNLLKNTIESK